MKKKEAKFVARLVRREDGKVVKRWRARSGRDMDSVSTYVYSQMDLENYQFVIARYHAPARRAA